MVNVQEQLERREQKSVRSVFPAYVCLCVCVLPAMNRAMGWVALPSAHARAISPAALELNTLDAFLQQEINPPGRDTLHFFPDKLKRVLCVWKGRGGEAPIKSCDPLPLESSEGRGLRLWSQRLEVQFPPPGLPWTGAGLDDPEGDPMLHRFPSCSAH